MKGLRRASAVLLGMVLFLAGILKLMDPVGAGLVMHEYFSFMHLGFLYPLSYPAGMAAALVETMIGAAMITGVQRRITALAGLVVLAGFTVLTLFILILNPDMDCGCFGEIVKLTHLQSFLKNLALLALWALAFLPFNSHEPTRSIRYASFGISAASVVAFAIYSALTLPLIDFTKFKQGSELMSAYDLEAQEDALFLEYNDGMDEYSDSLILEKKVIVASVYDPHRLKAQAWENIENALATAEDEGYTAFLLAASTYEDIRTVVSSQELLSRTYFADRKELMTINRSNGGVSFIADGLIISKWCNRHLPDRQTFERLSQEDLTESLISENSGARLKFQAFLLYVFAVMLLL